MKRKLFDVVMFTASMVAMVALLLLALCANAKARDIYNEPVIDNAGKLVTGGRALVYNWGTTTLATVYTVAGVQITQPIAADAGGYIIFAADDGAYRIQFYGPGVTPRSLYWQAIDLTDGIETTKTDVDWLELDVQSSPPAGAVAEGWLWYNTDADLMFRSQASTPEKVVRWIDRAGDGRYAIGFPWSIANPADPEVGDTYFSPSDGLKTWNGSIWTSGGGGGGGLAEVADDGSPQLGGDLDVNGYDIVSDSADITLEPTGGQVVLDGISWPSSDGSNGQVLTTDGAGNATWETVTGTGDLVGPASATNNAVPLFDGTTGKLVKNSALTYDPATSTVSGINAFLADLGFSIVGNSASNLSLAAINSGAGVYNILVDGTVNGRNMTTDGAKLDGIATGADDVNSTTVSAAGAVMHSLSDAKGDIIAATGANVFTRLPVGATNGHVLTVDSTEPTGMKWTSVVGTGDVVGPASAVNGELAVFDGTTGKAIEGGTSITAAGGDLAGVATISDVSQLTIDTSAGLTIYDSGADTTTVTLVNAHGTGEMNLDVEGDIAVGGTVDGRDLSTDGTKLDGIEAAADVTDSLNVVTAGAVMRYVANAKGDLLAATADNTVTRLAVGTNGYVLTANSATATGLEWAVAGSGSGDVVGPVSSTDNAVATWDGATGELLQNTALTYTAGTLSGASSIACVQELYCDGAGTGLTFWENYASDVDLTLSNTGAGDFNLVLDGTVNGVDIDATGITDGYVLTASGSGTAAWEAPGVGGGGGVDTSGTPVDNDFAKFTDANTIEGRSYSEVLSDLSLDADLTTFSLPASTTISAFGATVVDDASASAGRATLGVREKFGITIEDPADTDIFCLGITNGAITITDIETVIDAGTSVAWTLYSATTPTGTTNTHDSGSATTTIAEDSSHGDATIADGLCVNLDIGTVTGTVGQIHVTVYYTVD